MNFTIITDPKGLTCWCSAGHWPLESAIAEWEDPEGIGEHWVEEDEGYDNWEVSVVVLDGYQFLWVTLNEDGTWTKEGGT